MLKEELKNIKSGTQEIRNFSLVIGIAILLVGSYLWLKKNSFQPILFSLGLLTITTGYFFQNILRPFFKIWMSLGIILGWLTSRIILMVVFFLVLTPISLIRFLGKKFLMLEWGNHKNSYWQKKEINQPKKENYEQQF